MPALTQQNDQKPCYFTFESPIITRCCHNNCINVTVIAMPAILKTEYHWFIANRSPLVDGKCFSSDGPQILLHWCMVNVSPLMIANPCLQVDRQFPSSNGSLIVLYWWIVVSPVMDRKSLSTGGWLLFLQ